MGDWSRTWPRLSATAELRHPAAARTRVAQRTRSRSRGSGGSVEVIHPLANRDDDLGNPFNDVLIADVFNLNRRPGAIYLAV